MNYIYLTQSLLYRLIWLSILFLVLVRCSGSGSSTNPSQSISVTDIENDTVPKLSKEWEWSCDSDTLCRFRFAINQSQTHIFSENDDYSSETTKIEELGDKDEGMYYLHVQAKDLSGNESNVKTALFILELPRSSASEISLVLVDPIPQANSLYRSHTPTIEVRRDGGESLGLNQQLKFYNAENCNSLNAISDLMAPKTNILSAPLTTNYLHHGIHNIYVGIRTKVQNGQDSFECGTKPLSYVVYDPIVTGHKFSCRLNATGSVKCWGKNDEGQLGQGNSNESGKEAIGDGTNEMGNNLPAVNLGNNRTARFITAGIQHVCAILDNNSVKCWGKNDQGQLGQGNSNESGKEVIGDDINEMGDNLPEVDLGENRTVKVIAAGGDYTCAILDNNDLKCWGKNNEYQLGIALNTKTYGDDADEMGDNLPKVDLGDHYTAKAVSAGNDRACAILNNDSVKCWGRRGFLDTESDETPLFIEIQTSDPNLGRPYNVNLGVGRTAKIVTAGGYHTCTILDNDQVKCWGLNDEGQLGLGDTENRGDDLNEMGDNLPEINLGVDRIAKAITAGDKHTCAILALGNDHFVKCWGYNGKGQLGLGDVHSRSDEEDENVGDLQEVDLGSTLIVKAIAAGDEHTCALLGDADDVKCWGYNDKGQLGQEDNDSRGNEPNEMGDNLSEIKL